MDKSVKKIVSYILISLVLFFTVIAILGEWGFIEFEDVIRKIIGIGVKEITTNYIREFKPSTYLCQHALIQSLMKWR